MRVHPEALFTGGYALLLLAAGWLLDRLAQHASARSERFRTAGFRYHSTHDAWVCPQEQYLWPQEYDAQRRLLRYRAKPSVCNACPVKADCTDSPHGREVVRPLDPWPHSEAGRFHRGLALVLVLLAALFALSGAAAWHASGDLAALGAVLLAAAALGWRLSDHFRRTPSGFPAPTPATGLRVPVARDRYGRRPR